MQSCPWSGYEPGTIAFCEERLCAFIAEPSNTWSNLAYIAFGVIILAGVGLRRRARVAPELILVGVTEILIGLGSFVFHATGTRIGEVLDVGAMYLMTALGITLAYHRLRPLSVVGLSAVYVGISAASVALMLASGTNGIVVFAIELVAAVVLEVIATRRSHDSVGNRELLRMGITFLCAFAIWNTDKWGLLCRPSNHLVTGHAVWHVLCALSVFFYARHQAERLGASRDPA